MFFDSKYKVRPTFLKVKNIMNKKVELTQNLSTFLLKIVQYFFSILNSQAFSETRINMRSLSTNFIVNQRDTYSTYCTVAPIVTHDERCELEDDCS